MGDAMFWAGVTLAGGAVLFAVRQWTWTAYWRREAMVMGRMNAELIRENEALYARVRGAEREVPDDGK